MGVGVGLGVGVGVGLGSPCPVKQQQAKSGCQKGVISTLGSHDSLGIQQLRGTENSSAACKFVITIKLIVKTASAAKNNALNFSFIQNSSLVLN